LYAVQVIYNHCCHDHVGILFILTPSYIFGLATLLVSSISATKGTLQ